MESKKEHQEEDQKVEEEEKKTDTAYLRKYRKFQILNHFLIREPLTPPQI